MTSRKIDSPTIVRIACFAVMFWSMSLLCGQYAKSAEAMGPPVSFSKLVQKVKGSVVNISTTEKIKEKSIQQFQGFNSPFGQFFGNQFKNFFGKIPQGQVETHALGSGFLISRSGLILTNNHVVDHATKIIVKTINGNVYKAKIVGRDPKTDLALLKIKPNGQLPAPVKLGDSAKMRVGDWVIAVGNPFGLSHTVTAGIISAKGRVIGEGPYDDFLQTDAAINPGNSGGPLFNMQGEVIGINTAIIAKGFGIGFAIPINMAKELLPQLKTGKVIRAWIGVMIQNITPTLARSFGITETKGVIVADVVSKGPGEKAGIKRGDIIQKLNGKQVLNAGELSRTVAYMKPGTKVSLAIIRNGKPSTVEVTLGTMPAKLGQTEALAPETKSAWGVTVQNLTPETRQKFGLSAGETGVVITSIAEGSPASEGMLRTGDVIEQANHRTVKNIKDWELATQKMKKGQPLLLLVRRGANTFFVAMQRSGK